MIDSLSATAAAAAVLVLSVVVGVRLTTTLRPLRSPILALAASAGLGAGLYATALLAVTAMLGVSARSVWATTIVVALVALPAAKSALTLVAECVTEWRLLVPPLANIPVIIAAAVLWLSAAPVPVDFDSLMYHIRGPEQYLLASEIAAPRGNSHVAFVGALHMPYLPFLLLGKPAAAALLQAAFTMLAFLVAIVTAQRWLHVRAAALVALVLLGGPILLRVGATPMIEGGLALLLLSAHLVLLDVLRRPGDATRSAALAGALIGLAVGTKILAGIYAVALAVVLVPVVLLRGRHRGAGLRAVGVALACSVVFAAPWLLRTTLLYGAPAAPYFVEPSLPAWAAAPAAQLELPTGTSALRDVRDSFSIRAWFFSPGRLTPEGDGYLFGANFVFAALLLLPLIRHRLRVGLLVAPAVLYAAMLLSWTLGVNLRYLIPVFLPLTIASAAAVVVLTDRLRNGWLRPFARTAIGIAVAITPMIAIGRELEFSERPKAALGLIEAEQYRSRRDEIASLRGYVNGALPPNAQVLFLFEGRAFGIRLDVVQDNAMDNWRLLRPLVARGSCLEELGFTHVVVGKSTLNYLLRRGLDREAAGVPELEAFLQRCTTAGMGDALHTVYTLVPRS